MGFQRSCCRKALFESTISLKDVGGCAISSDFIDIHESSSPIFVMDVNQFTEFLNDAFEFRSDTILELVGKICVEDNGEAKRINTFEFLILIIVLSKWSIASKIDLILILFDMQSSESMSISELLIAFKTVLNLKLMSSENKVQGKS